MKKTELIFNVITVPADFLAIICAAILAYFLRYEVGTFPVMFDLSFRTYLGLIVIPIIFLMMILALSGLYTQKATRSFWREVVSVITAVSAGLMIVVLLFFFNQELFPSRLIILMNWAFIIVLVGLARGILLVFQRRMLEKGIGLHRMFVIVGRGGGQLLEEIEKDKRLGYEIVEKKSFSETISDTLEQAHKEKRIDELLLTDSSLSNDDVLRLVTLCEDLGISFNYVPSILETHLSNLRTDVIGSVPIIRLKGTPLEGWGSVLKRIIDIIGSGFGLIVLLPILTLIAAAIKIDSRGPVFFHQRRGSSYHNFEFYKFRTMYYELSEGTPEGDRARQELESKNVRRGPYIKIKDDPRVTRVGRFLRKTKLDEFPSLWHVLKGDMSLVGPRIHMTKEVEHFETKHKRLFNAVKPGITGLAQINQSYNPELPFEEEIKYDLFYIENWSVRLDIYLILKTAIILFFPHSEGNY